MTQSGSDSLHGSQRRFDIELFIVHPTLAPTEIGAALGLETKHAHRVGDRKTTPSGRVLPGTHQDTRWRHSSRYETNNQLFVEGLTALLDQLKSHKAFFGQLRSTGGTASVIIQFLGDGYFGDEISRDIMATLVDLELDLAIECFVAPQT